MVKILFQSLFRIKRDQSRLIFSRFIFYFLGPNFFDIDSGMRLPLNSPPTQHYTIIFNVLVMMSICNEINARKINDERNVFDSIWSNKVYILVIIGTFITQVNWILDCEDTRSLPSNSFNFDLFFLPLSELKKFSFQ